MNFLTNYKGLVDSVLKQTQDMKIQQPNCLLPLWLQWYNGLVPDFHEYYAWNGNNNIKKLKKRLNMGKRVCEDWASLLMSEKVQITISNDQDKLDRLLKSRQVNLWTKANRAVEVGFALSYSAIVAELKNIEFDQANGNLIKTDKAQVGMSYYRATQVVPITIDNGEFTEVAFVSEATNYTQVNIHKLDEEGNYHILMYRKNKSDQQEEYVYDLNTMSKEPLFAIIRPNIENNIYSNNDYPISIYANSIDAMQALDNAYDSLDIEFVNGKKRIFVSADMTHFVYRKNGDQTEAQQVNTFADNDASIWVVPPDKDGKNLVYAPNDPLRIADITNGIYAHLNILSSQCGLGNGYYRFDRSGEVTATQVISENSDTFRNKKKHELLLEPALITIVKALIYCNNTFTNNDYIDENADISIIFDDSIIQDKEAEQRLDQTNMQHGIMSKVEYRMKYFGEDEDTAKEKIYSINGRIGLSNRINTFLNAFQNGAMPPKMFAMLTFSDDDLQACGMTRDELLEFFENSKEGEINVDDILGLGGYNAPRQNPSEGKEDLPEEQEENPKDKEE